MFLAASGDDPWCCLSFPGVAFVDLIISTVTDLAISRAQSDCSVSVNAQTCRWVTPVQSKFFYWECLGRRRYRAQTTYYQVRYTGCSQYLDHLSKIHRNAVLFEDHTPEKATGIFESWGSCSCWPPICVPISAGGSRFHKKKSARKHLQNSYHGVGQLLRPQR